MGWIASGAIVGLLGVAALCGSVGACSGGVFAESGDGGTEGGTSGTSGATSGGTSGTSGATSGGTSGSSGAFEGGSVTPVCAPALVPPTALAAVSIKFDALDASGGAQSGWRSIGFDRDGLCTTKDSTDVCMRAAGAPATAQDDGDNGIDNAWGHTITPLLTNLSSQAIAGYLTTDATGAGTLRLAFGGNAMDVPVTSAKVIRQGTTATISAIVPTEAFVTVMARIAGRISASLCSGSTLDSIKQTIRQASDLPLMGAQSPLVACAAISLGATLAGVVDGTAPVIDPGPDPCAP